MNAQEAITAISTGNVVETTAEEWPTVRTAIQEQAAKWIDWGDGMRAMIALEEVRRLDTKFNYRLGD